MTAEERAEARRAGAAMAAGIKLTDEKRARVADMLIAFRASNAQRRNDAPTTRAA